MPNKYFGVTNREIFNLKLSDINLFYPDVHYIRRAQKNKNVVTLSLLFKFPNKKKRKRKIFTYYIAMGLAQLDNVRLKQTPNSEILTIRNSPVIKTS